MAVLGVPVETGQAIHRRIWRRPIVVATVIGLLSPGVWWVRDTGIYVWSSQRVTLTWQCANGIFLPTTTGALHYRWWAGDNPAPKGSGRFITSSPTSSGSQIANEATGEVHFDSLDHATFRSDDGETLVFTRQPRTAFYNAGCRIGGPLA